MRASSALRRSGRSNGFSLIEVLIALSLLGVALMLGVGLVLQSPRIVRRSDGSRQAYRAMESTLEAVRAGVIPLQSSRLDDFATAVGTPAPKDLTIWMQVDPAGTPGLFDVKLRATYTVFGYRHERRIETMVWSPPPEDT